MSSVLIEAHYLPSIAYFAALTSYQEVILEKHEHYIKQTYRNRCYINTCSGRVMLVVPLTSSRSKIPYCQAEIDYSQKWLNNHWRTIQSAYGKAPFFEYYSDALYKVLWKRHQFIHDLNVDLLSLCLKWLNWNTTITETTLYEKVPGKPAIDLRNALNPKKNTGSNINVFPIRYSQVFGSKFVPGLSLIDLIFCTGPEATRYVREAAGMK